MPRSSGLRPLEAVEPRHLPWSPPPTHRFVPERIRLPLQPTILSTWLVRDRAWLGDAPRAGSLLGHHRAEKPSKLPRQSGDSHAIARQPADFVRTAHTPQTRPIRHQAMNLGHRNKPPNLVEKQECVMAVIIGTSKPDILNARHLGLSDDTVFGYPNPRDPFGSDPDHNDNDQLYEGDGADHLLGGTGQDYLYGDGGN